MKPGPPRSEDDDAPAPSGFQPTELIAPAPGGLVDLERLPGHDLPTPADPRSTAAKPTLSHIGRYALKQRLAVGGLGAVYEAWDPLLSRTVAVKTLQFDLDTPARVSLDGLFLNEARTAASLDQRGIVTVHDAGLSAHGVYIAMERLVGRDLRDALAQGWRPSPARAALLGRRIAEALAYAHSRGVVHCDIKPANIFLTEKLRPKVLDFGIARAAGAGTPVLDGLIAGSPHYLAPEQLRGGEVTERTDVYSLGVVLYELLTARKAFDGESLEAITQAVLAREVPCASEVDPEVPRALAAIVSRAMARDPAHRHASATALAHALRAWLGEKIVAGVPPAAVAGRADEDNTPAHTLPARPAAPAASGADPGDPGDPDHGVPTWSGKVVTAPTSSRADLTPLQVAGILGLLALLLMGLFTTRGDPRPESIGADTGAAITSGSNGSPSSVTAALSIASPEPAPGGAAVSDASLPAAAGGSDLGGSAAEAAARAASANRPATRSPRPAVKPMVPSVATTAAPAPPVQGTVRFAITPWGHVDIDGATIGIAPPLTTMMLPVGEHQVVIRNDGAPAYAATIFVDAERPVVVRHRFVP